MADRIEIDQVRNATDLVELIGAHVSLEAKGREHVGLCPFHDDHKPSMSVVTHHDQSFYKCFSCGAGGDAFTFLKEHLKMEFGEALEFLADKAGITLTRQAATPEITRQREQRDHVRRANDRATDFFRQTLASEAGASARAMLAERGISEDMIESFQIGAAPPVGWDGLTRSLPDKQVAYEAFTAAGLLKTRKEGNGYYDTFRNRLIFPICNQAGQPVAFGGRIIAEDDEPKYLNSPETEVFQKGRTLYGMHLAHRSVMDTGCAIVAEGYTDVIACHQAGFRNVVGTLGTALTDEHARILSRLCTKVILLFDGDEAGRRAAKRALEVFLNHPIDILICTLPDGMDPADLLALEEGSEQFKEYIDGSTDVLKYVLEHFEESLEQQDSMSGRQRTLEQFVAELGRIGLSNVQGARRAFLMSSLSELTKIPLADIEGILATANSSRSRPITTVEPTSQQESLLDGMGEAMLPKAREVAEHEYLALLLIEQAGHEPGSLLGIDCFLGQRSRELARHLLPKLEAGETAPIHVLLDDIHDQPTRELTSLLYFVGQRLHEQEPDEFDPVTPLQRVTRSLQSIMDGARTDQRLSDFNATSGGDPIHMINIIAKQGPRPSAIHREKRL